MLLIQAALDVCLLVTDYIFVSVCFLALLSKVSWVVKQLFIKLSCSRSVPQKREQKTLIKKGQLMDCPEKAFFGERLNKLQKKSTQRYKSKVKSIVYFHN